MFIRHLICLTLIIAALAARATEALPDPGADDVQFFPLLGPVHTVTKEVAVPREGAEAKRLLQARWTFDRQGCLTEEVRYFPGGEETPPGVAWQSTSLNLYDDGQLGRREITRTVQGGGAETVEIVYTYELQGRLAEEYHRVQPFGGEPRAEAVSYAYDDENRVIETRFDTLDLGVKVLRTLLRCRYEAEGAVREEIDGRTGRVKRRTWQHADGKVKQEFTYSAKEEIAEKTFYRYNDVGNLERIAVARDGRWTRLVHYADYTLDARGNWTQRTQYVVKEKDGQETLLPYQTVYRTITYYE